MIFEIVDNEPKITSEALTVPEFKELWDRDESEDKEEAQRELAYVFHMCDFASPYVHEEEEKKEETIKQDMFGYDWEPDEAVENAMEKYRKLFETPTMRQLRTTKIAIDKLNDYLEGANVSDKNLKAYREAISDQVNTANSFNNLKKAVEEELMQQRQQRNKIKGNKVPNFMDEEET